MLSFLAFGDFDSEVKGVNDFPKDEQLGLCLSVSYMNSGNYEKALSFLLKLQHLKDGLYFIARSYQALNDAHKAEQYLNRYDQFD